MRPRLSTRPLCRGPAMGTGVAVMPRGTAKVVPAKKGAPAAILAQFLRQRSKAAQPWRPRRPGRRDTHVPVAETFFQELCRYVRFEGPDKAALTVLHPH